MKNIMTLLSDTKKRLINNRRIQGRNFKFFKYINMDSNPLLPVAHGKRSYLCNGYRRFLLRGQSDTDMSKERRFQPKKKTLLRNCSIAGAGSMIAIITLVLSISVFGTGNSIYTADAEATANTQNTIVELNKVENTQTSTLPTTKSTVPSDEPAEKLDAAPQIMSGPTASSEPLTDPAAATDITALVPECHDPRIIGIQTRLMELDYMDSDEPTDYYGWGTKYSLELFQRKNKLQIDGLVGQETLTKLFSSDALPYTVKLGDRGTDVETLQERLTELKYYKSAVSGRFDKATAAAIQSFQKVNNLTVDGDVGEQTRDALFSENAKPAPKTSKKSTAVNTKTTSAASSSNSPASGNDSTAVAAQDSSSNQSSVDKLISVAKSLLGSRYILGAKGPHSFDCSGFVYYCLNQAGYKIDYMVSTDWATCSLPKVKSMGDMKPGDIICYSPHHVAIYIGGGQMIDASSSNGKVVQRPCDTSYWQSHFRCARRVF